MTNLWRLESLGFESLLTLVSHSYLFKSQAKWFSFLRSPKGTESAPIRLEMTTGPTEMLVP